VKTKPGVSYCTDLVAGISLDLRELVAIVTEAGEVADGAELVAERLCLDADGEPTSSSTTSTATLNTIDRTKRIEIARTAI
jgi:hypothetical protein